MMLRLRKTLAFLFALALVIGVMTGCGTGNPVATTSSAPPQSADQESSNAPAPTGTPLPPVELSWYYFGNSPGTGQAAVEQALDNYLEDKINATIKFYPLDWNGFATTVGAKTASNEPFDLVFSPSWIGFLDYAAKNVYLDITDSFPKYCPKTKELLGEFLQAGYLDGKLLAIPTMKELAHTFGYMVNKQLMDKYNFDIDTLNTPADLEPMLAIIKANEPDIIPFAVDGGTSLVSTVSLDPVSGDNSYGVAALAGTTKVMNQFEIPEYVDALRMSRDWYLKGYIDKNAATDAATNSQKLAADKANGKVFACVGSIYPGVAALNSNDKVTWEEKQVTDIYTNLQDQRGSMNSISITSQNPDRALMFLELVNTDPVVNNLIAWGIENKNYVVQSPGVIHQITDSDYVHTNQWVFGNEMINYLKDTESPTKWEDIRKFNESAIPEKSMGFQWTKADEFKSQIDACRLIEGKQYLQYGVSDIDTELPKLITQLKQAGIDDIVASIQTEYDAWLASKSN
jgi:putative aldouronate transport system substrate-binding protein